MDWSSLKAPFVSILSLTSRCVPRCWKRSDDANYISRLVSRDGKVQICLDQISFGKRRRYWRNPLTTLLDLKWRWVIVIFILGFLSSWTLFATLYYAIAKTHGDLNITDPDFIPCINDVNSFTSAFLFSLETQHTIGYGSRNPTTECSIATFTVFSQFIIGAAIQCVTAGLVVAKLQMGKRTSKAIQFSERACVGKCDGEVCLMVRVGNAGGSEVVNTRGFGILIERDKLDNGEETFTESVLEFQTENGSESLNLLWPAVIHYMVLGNCKDFIRKLQRQNNELVVVIEGVLLSTGQTLQLRSSYLPHEIDIGKQFVDISPKLVINKNSKSYYHSVDYSDFNVTQPDENWDFKLWSPRQMT